MSQEVQLLRRRQTNTLIISPHQLGIKIVDNLKYLANVENAAQDAVKELLFTFYNEDFKVLSILVNLLKGIIIQVNKIVVDKEYIRTLDDSPNMFVDIQYTLTLLTLPVGALLQGTLMQQFQSHLVSFQVQLLGLFNVIVDTEDINPKQMKWSEEFQAYVDQNQQQILEVGELIQFQVTKFDSHDSKHMDIKGSLKLRNKTGLVKYLTNPVPLPQKTDKIIEQSQEKLL